MHVFGLDEETGIPGGNPQSTGSTHKLHAHRVEGGVKNPTVEMPGNRANRYATVPLWFSERKGKSFAVHENVIK